MTGNGVPQVLRYTAFSDHPGGGNPAGVVLDARTLPDDEMLAIAADVGYSETAFLIERSDRFDVRYFSPLAEVSFCGHATIASAVAWAERHGPGRMHYETAAGPVEVSTQRADDGSWRATLTSVPPRTADLSDDDRRQVLAVLGWSDEDLDPDLPPRVAFAGAWHPILAARSQERLAGLAYDMAALGALMAARNWTTVDLVWRESATVFHARNPFPSGGVVEDPATGAAAAALGGYLRELAAVDVPATLTVLQGAEMGRPSVLTVDIPAEPRSGIRVGGAATAIPLESGVLPEGGTQSSPSHPGLHDPRACGASLVLARRARLVADGGGLENR
jgi:PhzF family phenazine biosynthesis protein